MSSAGGHCGVVSIVLSVRWVMFVFLRLIVRVLCSCGVGLGINSTEMLFVPLCRCIFHYLGGLILKNWCRDRKQNNLKGIIFHCQPRVVLWLAWRAGWKLLNSSGVSFIERMFVGHLICFLLKQSNWIAEGFCFF